MSTDKPYLLVVEDEATQRQILTEYLSRQGLRVAAVSGALMREALHAELLRITLLDIGLPGEDGFALAPWLRERHPRMGIIMVTGASDPVDRIVGLETGADDYVTKPCDPLELLGRIKSVLRRTGAQEPVTNPGAAALGTGSAWVQLGRCRFDRQRRILLAPDGTRRHLRPSSSTCSTCFPSIPTGHSRVSGFWKLPASATTTAVTAALTCASPGYGEKSRSIPKTRGPCAPCAASATRCR